MGCCESAESPQVEDLSASKPAAPEPKSDAASSTAAQGAEATDVGAEFTVTLKKQSEGDKLGLDITHAKDKTHLKIKAVKEGLVKRWNDENPSMQVREKDLIIGCNGSRGDSQKMLELVTESTIVLQIKRGE